MSLAADRRLERIIGSGELTGAFFLHGDAARLRDDAARSLTQAALDPVTGDFNLDVFHAAEAAPDALAAALAMPPIMAARRVVALYDAERLSPKGCDVVVEAIKALPPDLTVIVTATIPKGSRKAFFRVLKEKAVSLEWKAPRDADIPGWLIERARTRYVSTLEVEAAQALAGAVGSDLSLLDAELEKLCQAGDGVISLSQVEQLVPNVREVNRWAWLDLVASREYRQARRQLPVLMSGPDASAVGLVSAMVDQHLYLGIALEGGAEQVEQTLSEVGKPYLRFKARTYERQARRWTRPAIERALRLLQQTDARAKTSGGDHVGGLLEELLLELEHYARGAG